MSFKTGVYLNDILGKYRGYFEGETFGCLSEAELIFGEDKISFYQADLQGEADLVREFLTFSLVSMNEGDIRDVLSFADFDFYEDFIGYAIPDEIKCVFSLNSYEGIPDLFFAGCDRNSGNILLVERLNRFFGEKKMNDHRLRGYELEEAGDIVLYLPENF